MRLERLENRDNIPTKINFLSHVDKLMSAVTETIDTCIPKCRPAPHQKCWWSQELMDRHNEVCRLAQRAYGRRSELGDLIHTNHKEARRHYATMIKNMKRYHGEGFLAHMFQSYSYITSIL